MHFDIPLCHLWPIAIFYAVKWTDCCAETFLWYQCSLNNCLPYQVGLNLSHNPSSPALINRCLKHLQASLLLYIVHFLKHCNGTHSLLFSLILYYGQHLQKGMMYKLYLSIHQAHPQPQFHWLPQVGNGRVIRHSSEVQNFDIFLQIIFGTVSYLVLQLYHFSHAESFECRCMLSLQNESRNNSHFFGWVIGFMTSWWRHNVKST